MTRLIIPCHAMPYHAIPCHIIPSHCHCHCHCHCHDIDLRFSRYIGRDMERVRLTYYLALSRYWYLLGTNERTNKRTIPTGRPRVGSYVYSYRYLGIRTYINGPAFLPSFLPSIAPTKAKGPRLMSQNHDT